MEKEWEVGDKCLVEGDGNIIKAEIIEANKDEFGHTRSVTIKALETKYHNISLGSWNLIPYRCIPDERIYEYICKRLFNKSPERLNDKEKAEVNKKYDKFIDITLTLRNMIFNSIESDEEV